MGTNHADLVARNKAATLASWTAQAAWDPLSMVRAERVYFWDADGKRYLDFSSQVFNVNIGHGHPHVIKAIQEQAGSLAYAYSGIATEVRARLAEMLREIAPAGLTKTFFTLGGTDAVENALKIARLYTGRQKILARYRAYHGATFGAMSAGGDPRRLANEPGVPWVVHFHDPYAYRSPLYRGRSEDEGDGALVDQIEETILYEGPESIAAILLEGYSGTSGIIQGGEVFWRGVSDLCKKYELLLIIDEVLSGFGRTGEWFGVDHYPYVKPDILAMAKGLTSGYAPLGAAMVSDSIAAHFDTETLWAGLTYSSHPLCLAAAIATIEVYQQEKLIENSREMGKLLRRGLLDLAENHPSVGDVRGVGLHQILELVSDRSTRSPLSPYNQPLSEPMRAVSRYLREAGMSTFVKWNWIFCSPPLVITPAEIEAGLKIIDSALDEADRYYTG